MNKHLLPEELCVPSLTPAERVEALMDAFVKHQQLAAATFSLRMQLDKLEVETREREAIWDRHDETLHSEMGAQDEVVAHVKVLMAGRYFERMAEMLRAETIGRG